MNKAVLVPLYFDPGRDGEFDAQLSRLNTLLKDEAEFLPPVALGKKLPAADAVIFPQILGEAYRQVEKIKKIPLPILIVTSRFGTLSMWDWEIKGFLAAEGILSFAPYDLADTRKLCAMLAVKRELRSTRFLVFQDNPGEGFQAEIFKRFYWWEDLAVRAVRKRFGVTVRKKSFAAFGARARAIPDEKAEAALAALSFPRRELPPQALRSAVKLYLALAEEAAADESIKAMGINCLNESHFSDTTPCLAWNLLFKERGLTWGCEADLLSMMTQHLIYRSLGVPLMMTNIYPFLMGETALTHEKIKSFPRVASAPEDHILTAHCGYLGVLPEPFASDWELAPKVLAIVNDNAHAIDARLPEGDVTLVKLDPRCEKLLVIEGSLEGYAGFPGSDCRNGAVIRVPDGHALMRRAGSHHQILCRGHLARDLEYLCGIFELQVVRI
ncbi:MAG TPA: hypothetical protein ENN69_03510 [Spirochaetia bacterium]|nr:hypothetical protein [Spirochaetia bacterium]